MHQHGQLWGVSFLILGLAVILGSSQDIYPCRRNVVFSLDMSSAVGSVQDQSLFSKQVQAIKFAYHSWHLSTDAVRVMIPKPNGAYKNNDMYFHDDVVDLDDVLTLIEDGDNSAYHTSDLKEQMRQLGSNIDNSRDQTVRYSVVIFAGSKNPIEIENATQQADDSLTGDLERIVVVVGDASTDLYKDLGKDGVLTLADLDLYTDLTNEICDDVVEVDPSPVPTGPLVPAYPGNVDIFVQFTATDCPMSSQINAQTSVIRALIRNSTFENGGVRMAVPEPIGMVYTGSNILYYSVNSVVSEINSIALSSQDSYFCQKGGTILDSFTNINNWLRIKPDSAAVIILFTESSSSTDIQWSTDYRKCHFDSRGVKLITVALDGSSPLANLASPSSSFTVTDYNIIAEITAAIQSTTPFLNATVDC